MDCINLKVVRWLRFNSSASYWLGIFLINQPIDLKSQFLTPLLKSLVLSPQSLLFVWPYSWALFFFNVMIPCGDIWKITHFITSVCVYICIKTYTNTAICHFLENTDFCEWWQLSLLKQIECDWSQTENSCCDKCTFLLKSILSKNISCNFLGCERHWSSSFQKGQKDTWYDIILHKVQWYFFLIYMNPIEKLGFWGTYQFVLVEFNEWCNPMYLSQNFGEKY